MPRYVLKKYTREDPTSTVGVLIAEWSIQATNDSDAEKKAMAQLTASNFQQPKDFAVLRDEGGKPIWEAVNDT